MNQRERKFTRGFLLEADPLTQLSEPFAEWEAVARQLAKLTLSPHIRPILSHLPPFPTHLLQTRLAYERAMTMLAYMANLYVFAPNQTVATRLPRSLAVPFCQVAAHLERPPILSYASQSMYNWRRIDPNGPIAVGNLTLIQNFLGGMDEEWFVTLHINIEAVAGKALSLLLPAQTAVSQQDHHSLIDYLHQIARTLDEMAALLNRMPERCDPYIYYHRVRPFMFGWKGNPDIPGGMVYEGVEHFGDRPMAFRGETGAQSGIIPAIDAALCVSHEFDDMRAYLLEMRDYMPADDRRFVEALENGPSVRCFVKKHKTQYPSLREAYNHAVHRLQAFRQLHIEYAARYIIKPAEGEKKGDVGTGGTPFTVYLKKHIRETAAHLI